MKKCIRIAAAVVMLAVLASVFSSCFLIADGGTFENGVVDYANKEYTNSSIGIGIKLEGNDWEFKTTEQLKSIAESMGTLDGSVSIIYDFFAVNSSDGSNIYVTVDDMKANYGQTVSEENYLSGQIDEIRQMYTESGFTVDDIGLVKVKCAGKSFNALYYSGVAGGSYRVCQYTLVKKIGQYMVMISLTAPSKEKLDGIRDLFYEV